MLLFQGQIMLTLKSGSAHSSNFVERNMAKNTIIDVTGKLLDDYLSSEGKGDLEIYHIEFQKEGSDKVLRVYIDRRDGYISTDDCEDISRYLSDKLDELDPIEDNYILEVSSPGLDRTLVTDAHFQRYIGEIVEVSLYKTPEVLKSCKLLNPKKLEGILREYRDGNILVELTNMNEGKGTPIPDELEIESKDIAKVNLAVII